MNLHQLKQFLAIDLWRQTNEDLRNSKSPIVRLFYYTLKTVVIVIRGFVDKNLNARASALTYSLIFSIVPILAMVLAVAKGFGVADVIEEQLNKSFLSSTNIIPTIMEMVQRYLETAQGGVFIGVGILVLLWAIYSFFQNVESAFNGVWNVHASRSILRQVTTYIAILFLIPVLIIVTAGLSIFLSSAFDNIQQLGWLVQYRGWMMRLIQFIVVWALFTWMYIAIPNTKVHFLSGLIPGILMGTLFQLLQMLSVYIIVFLSRTSIVYGAFASIPILLTWLQWTCVLILLGVQMSFAIQNQEQFEYADDISTMSRRYKDFITLYILHGIIKRFNEDKTPLTACEIAQGYKLPSRLVSQLVSRLLEVGMIREVYIEGKEERTYQPAMATHTITIGKVIDRIDTQGSDNFLINTTPELTTFWNKYRHMCETHMDMNAILIQDL